MSDIPNHIDPDEVARMIMLTYGPMESGKGSFWCYVAVRPSQYDRFRDVQKAGKLNMPTFEQDGFGEVIVSGPGVFPPAEVTRQVAKMFEIPIKDLFSDVDPQSVISTKISQIKQQDNDGSQ